MTRIVVWIHTWIRYEIFFEVWEIQIEETRISQDRDIFDDRGSKWVTDYDLKKNETIISENMTTKIIS